MIHAKINAGRSRFGKYVAKHFKVFLALYKSNKGWSQFFADGGKAQAPLDYLVAIEKGLRSFGHDLHAMGSNAMKNKANYKKVDLWRKREAYIALMRHREVNNCSSYKQWDCFQFSDYTSRQRWALTFKTRHWPLSDGESHHFKGRLSDPDCWSEVVVSPPPRKKFKKAHSSPASTMDAATVAVSAATGTLPLMRFDVEKNCLVPFD